MAANKKGTKANAAKKLTPINAPLNKSAILAVVAENAGISKKQVSLVFEQLALLIESHLSKRNIGKFVLPGLLKIEIKRKPATKARKGINPFTGEETLFKAKPARNVVKIRPLKRVKDMVA
ncbi:MAG: DNA-binding protein [Desulfobacteraceae bacterium]|nr:MAG: DNA-binding protein [Desulfobacteraceae bacterium]